MANKRVLKSCPYCRLNVDRISHHIKIYHEADIPPERRMYDSLVERKRAEVASQSSVDIVKLKEKFPNSYLDVSEFIIENCHVPVFLTRTSSYVENMTLKQLQTWKDNPDTMPDVLKGRASPVKLACRKEQFEFGEMPVVELPVSATTKAKEHSTTEDQQNDDQNANYKQTSLISRSYDNSPEAVMNTTREEMNIPRTSTQDVISPGSATSEEDIRPISFHRSRVLDSDSDDDQSCDVIDQPLLPKPCRRSTRLPKLKSVINYKDYDSDNRIPDSDAESMTEATEETLSSQSSQRSDGLKTCRSVINNDDSYSDDSAPDTDSETDQSISKGTTKDKAKKITQQYKKYKMYVTAPQRDGYVKNLKVLQLLKEYYTSSGECATKNTHSMNNNLALACKIMKYCAPNHKVDGFQWSHLSAANIDLLISTLRNNIKLAPGSIANYLKVLHHLLSVLMKDEEYCKNTPNWLYDRHICYEKVKKLQKANAKEISWKRYTQNVSAINKEMPQYKHYLLQIFQVFEKAKDKCKRLLEKAKTEKLTAREKAQLNGFFNLLSLTCGNRPMAFKYMKSKEYKIASKHPKQASDGTCYYYIVKTEQRSGAQFVAFMYFTEEIMEMLHIYYKHVRKPLPSEKDYLFINCNGKRIHNPSNHLTKFIHKYDKKLGKILNHTLYRKILTTLSKTNLGLEQQRIMNGMLTHYEATAINHQIHGIDGSVPYKLGLPLIGELLQQCSRNTGISVTSYVTESSQLREEVTETAEQEILSMYKMLDRAKIDLPSTTEDLQSTSDRTGLAPSSLSPKTVPSSRPTSSRQESPRLISPASLSRPPSTGSTRSSQKSKPLRSGLSPSKSSTFTPASLKPVLSNSLANNSAKSVLEERLKVKLGTFDVNTQLPTIKEIKKKMTELNIPIEGNNTLIRMCQSYANRRRIACRAKQIADALKKVHDPTKFQNAIDAYMAERKWPKNVKTKQAALSLMRKNQI